MLLKFAVENWACFEERVEFSMFATRERAQNETLIHIGPKSKPLKILPVSMIYGGNAAGKSSLIKALQFVQSFVLGGYADVGARIAVNPYRLSARSVGRPSVFEIIVYAGEKIYELAFSVTADAVVHEKLSILNASGEVSKVCYERDGQKITFPGKPSPFCEFLGKATVPRRLFLSVAFQLNADFAKPVVDWFADTLHILTADTKLQNFEVFNGIACREKARLFLKRFGTGVERIERRQVSLESLHLNDLQIQELMRALRSVRVVYFRLGRESYAIFRMTAAPGYAVRQIFTVHVNDEGASVPFSLDIESDGTMRLLDFIPALHALEVSEKVFLIDEFECSLHPLVCQGLVEDFLAGCSADGRSQMIFTTHNVLLMRSKTLRRDETWIVNHEADGRRSLYSISVFKDVRNDLDILKSYLEGRMGGIPVDYSDYDVARK